MVRIQWANAARGIAALSVVIAHLGIGFWINPTAASLGRNRSWTGGGPVPLFVRGLDSLPLSFAGFGVGLFFLVSGFVISFSLDKYSRRGFLVGRLFRIIPTYAAGYLITCLVVFLMGDPKNELSPASVGIGMIPGLGQLLRVQTIPDGIVWTLTVEMVFYGICIVVFRKLTTSANYLVATGLGCALVQFAAARVAWLPELEGIRMIVLIATPFIPLMLVGVAASRLRKPNVQRTRWLAAAAVTLGLHIVLLATSPIIRPDLKYNASYVVAAVAMFAIAWSRIDFSGGKILTMLATISYPLYVVHAVLGYALLSIIVLASGSPYLAISIAFTAAVLTATILHFVVEKPTHIFGQRLAGRFSGSDTTQQGLSASGPHFRQ